MESFQVILPAKQAVRCHYVHSAHGTTSTIRKFGHLTIERSHVSKVSTSQIFQPGENRPVPCERDPRSKNRAIFVWPWNENARTKQKQQTNGNRAIWLVYRTDTNARGFWLVKRTLGWKNLHSRELSRNQPILRFDVILQHDWPIEQCILHVRVFFGGKTKRLYFGLSIHWLIKQITNTYRNHFSRS